MNGGNIEKEFGRAINTVVCRKAQSFDISAELNIPEGQAGIKRILTVTDCLQSPIKYASDRELECRGSCEYKLLYLGTDGGLYFASATGEYEFTVPFDCPDRDFATDGARSIVTLTSEGTTARLISMDKVNLKTRARASTVVFGLVRPAEDDPSGELQKKKLVCPASSVITLRSDPVELSGELGGVGDTARIAFADGSVFVTDTRMNADGILVSGDVSLKLLTADSLGRPRVLTKKLRFSETVECEELSSSSLACATGKITDMNISLDENSILAELTMIFDCTVCTEYELSYTADAYSTEHECTSTTEKLTIPSYAFLQNGNFSQSERLDRANTGLPEGAEIVDIYGKISFGEMEQKGNKCTFSGTSKYTLLYKNDEEYSVCDIELPIKYENDCKGEMSAEHSISAELLSSRVRLDGEVLSLDSEIGVSLAIIEKSEAIMLKDISIGEELSKKGCRIVVYYPAPDETPWDVAKKYHVPAVSLAEEKNYYLF